MDGQNAGGIGGPGGGGNGTVTLVVTATTVEPTLAAEAADQV